MMDLSTLTDAPEPKLTEIAERITKHLHRMEIADEQKGTLTRLVKYWKAHAWATGSRVGIRYLSYHPTRNLTKADALAYLSWLDAGNEGKHTAALALMKDTK